jgi:hypothetical protein
MVANNLKKADLKRRTIHGLQFFTDHQIKNRQKKFDKLFREANNPKIKHSYVDEQGLYTVIFKSGQVFKCRGPLVEGVYR